MRSSNGRHHAVAAGLVGLVALAGCGSLARDLGQVRALADGAPLPWRDGARPAIAAETPAEVGELLRRPLGAEAAVRVALYNQRELRATLHELGIARGQLLQAGLPRNPVVSVDVGAGTLGLGVEYDVTSLVLLPLRTRVARAQLDAARQGAAATVVATAFAARAAFYAVQAAEQRHALGNRALEAFAAGRDAARALFAAGNVPRLDLSTQETAYEEARAGVAALELEALARREELNRLLGLSGAETAWRTDGPLAPAPDALGLPADAERVAVAASLELGQRRGELRALAVAVDLERTSGWLPGVAVAVRGERERDPGGWHLGAGLDITLPLLDRREGLSAAARARLDAAVERYQGQAIAVRAGLRDARNRLQSAAARARHYAAVIVPGRRRVLAEAVAQYNAMSLGVFQLLEARRQELDAELAAVDTLREYWTARAAFDAILAGGRADAATTARPALPAVAGNQDPGGH